MKIVFMGSPAFAVPSLEAILSSKDEVPLVVSQPDKPSGRGLQLTPCAVAVYAKKHNLELFQPKTLRKKEIQEKIIDIKPDLIAVVAYGKILPKEILSLPKYGCINLHASLLPKYRGAAPINWAIVNGERKTGITTMIISEELDTGDMLLKKETEIKPDETTIELHDRLSQMGASLLVETIKKIRDGSVKRTPQNHSEATYAPLLKKEVGLINWKKDASEIHNLVRGMQPWPGAYTYYNKKKFGIWSSRYTNETQKELAGTVVTNQQELGIATGKGTIYLKEVQLEGKKRMKTEDFLRGHKIEKGERLS